MIYFEDPEEQQREGQQQLGSSKPAIFFEEELSLNLEEPAKVAATKQASQRKDAQSKVNQCHLAMSPSINANVSSRQLEQESDTSSYLSFTQKIERRFQEYRRDKEFLHSPTRPNSRLQLTLARRKDLLSSVYICTAALNNHTITMATKRQKHLKVDKYEVSMLTDFLEDIEHEPFFVGKISYSDGTYNFTDDGHFKVHTDESIVRRMGSVRIQRPLIGQDTMQLLTPAIQHGQICTIQANPMSELFDIAHRSGSVTKLLLYERALLSAVDLETMNQMMGCRKSKHAMALHDSRFERNCMVLARADDIAFKVEVYEGLSAFQAFCAVVAWLS